MQGCPTQHDWSHAGGEGTARCGRLPGRTTSARDWTKQRSRKHTTFAPSREGEEATEMRIVVAAEVALSRVLPRLAGHAGARVDEAGRPQIDAIRLRRDLVHQVRHKD